jgi:hypothetical protein
MARTKPPTLERLINARHRLALAIGYYRIAVHKEEPPEKLTELAARIDTCVAGLERAAVEHALNPVGPK